MNPEIDVPMNEMVFSRNGDKISTKGISTCIAFIVQGSFYENYQEIPFCGLYHWVGLAADEPHPDDKTMNVLYDFFDQLREQLGLDDDEEVTISTLRFIGGEKRQPELSGSEREVMALRKAAQKFDYEDECLNLLPNAIEHVNYLTSGMQSFCVKVTSDEVHYEFERFAEDEKMNEEVEAELSPMTSISF